MALTGRLTAPGERRTLPSGDEVVALRVVVMRPSGGSDAIPVQVGPAPGPGRRVRGHPTGRRALAAAERLTVGMRVRVRGTLRRRWWQTDGGRRSRVEVAAAELEVLGPTEP